jgi:hypothetical protein
VKYTTLLVILNFHKAQENRQFLFGDIDLMDRLERKVIVLAVIERARKKQCARIACIKDGDANIKFFLWRVNARRRKNHIHRLKVNHGWAAEHDAEEDIVHNHLQSAISRRAPRTHDFNWDELHFEDPDLDAFGDNLFGGRGEECYLPNAER